MVILSFGGEGRDDTSLFSLNPLKHPVPLKKNIKQTSLIRGFLSLKHLIQFH